MKQVKPIYIKLLIITTIIWIISMTFHVVNLYLKVGAIEHGSIHSHQLAHH